MNRIRHYAALGLLCALLTACASMGLAPAKSLTDRISYAYGTNAGVRNAAASALSAGTLKVEDAEYVLKSTDNTRTLLDASKAALAAGDPSTAEGRLVLALNGLTLLQDYLNKRVTQK
jgi:hypothetical protein